MKNFMNSKSIVRDLLFAGLIAVLWLALTPQTAQAQEIGNFCVQDYLPGAGCTANDVRIEELRIVNIVKPCNVAPIGVMDAEFEALVSADGSPDRYDIGLFLALDGGSALTGNSCYHDYLPPPLTTTPIYADKNSDGIDDIDNGPWWDSDGDSCGDIETDTQVFRLTQVIRVSCADIDANGAADISVCSSWDNNAGTACSSVQTAFPGTSSKCSCAVVNFDFTPTAIKGATISVKNEVASPKLLLPVLGLLLLFGLLVGYVRYRMARS